MVGKFRVDIFVVNVQEKEYADVLNVSRKRISWGGTRGQVQHMPLLGRNAPGACNSVYIKFSIEP